MSRDKLPILNSYSQIINISSLYAIISLIHKPNSERSKINISVKDKVSRYPCIIVPKYFQSVQSSSGCNLIKKIGDKSVILPLSLI